MNVYSACRLLFTRPVHNNYTHFSNFLIWLAISVSGSECNCALPVNQTAVRAWDTNECFLTNGLHEGRGPNIKLRALRGEEPQNCIFLLDHANILEHITGTLEETHLGFKSEYSADLPLYFNKIENRDFLFPSDAATTSQCCLCLTHNPLHAYCYS